MAEIKLNGTAQLGRNLPCLCISVSKLEVPITPKTTTNVEKNPTLPFQFFFSLPVVLFSFISCFALIREQIKSNKTEWLRKIWTGYSCPVYLFLQSCWNRVDLLLYESKQIEKRGQYEWMVELFLDGHAGTVVDEDDVRP